MPGVAAGPDPTEQYLQQKKIPQLFQSLTMALLYNQPGDHVEYLLQKLEEVKSMGSDAVQWDSFLPPGTPAPHPVAAAQADQVAAIKVSNFHGSMAPGAKP